LLDEWVEKYPYKLRNKLRLGTFVTDDPRWWEKINPRDYQAVWGGEYAAAKHTNFLNPKDGIVYINRNNIAEFINKARLRKKDMQTDTGYQVEIIELFWKPDQNEVATGVANPLITYADLIATAEPRNLEVAKRLREKLIH